MSHWLMKSEPDAFGMAGLARVRREPWSGVRNHQTRYSSIPSPRQLNGLYHPVPATTPSYAGPT